MQQLTNSNNNYFFYFCVHLFAPLWSVHASLFGELIGGLCAALLSIFNGLIQVSGDDIKGDLGMFAKHLQQVKLQQFLMDYVMQVVV